MTAVVPRFAWRQQRLEDDDGCHATSDKWHDKSLVYGDALALQRSARVATKILMMPFLKVKTCINMRATHKFVWFKIKIWNADDKGSRNLASWKGTVFHGGDRLSLKQTQKCQRLQNASKRGSKWRAIGLWRQHNADVASRSWRHGGVRVSWRMSLERSFSNNRAMRLSDVRIKVSWRSQNGCYIKILGTYWASIHGTIGELMYRNSIIFLNFPTQNTCTVVMRIQCGSMVKRLDIEY